MLMIPPKGSEPLLPLPPSIEKPLLLLKSDLGWFCLFAVLATYTMKPITIAASRAHRMMMNTFVPVGVAGFC